MSLLIVFYLITTGILAVKVTIGTGIWKVLQETKYVPNYCIQLLFYLKCCRCIHRITCWRHFGCESSFWRKSCKEFITLKASKSSKNWKRMLAVSHLCCDFSRYPLMYTWASQCIFTGTGFFFPFLYSCISSNNLRTIILLVVILSLHR